MKKKIYTIVIICAVLLTGKLISSYIHARIWDIGDSEVLDKETNDAIKELVYKAINVQYNRKYRKELDTIFTAELQQDIKERRPGFYLARLLFYVDKNYMKGAMINNDGDITIAVNVEDLSWNYYQVFTIIQQEDGTYIVSELEFDS